MKTFCPIHKTIAKLLVFIDREPFSKDNRSSPSPGLSGVIIKPKKVKI
jgi:hypothetical protein